MADEELVVKVAQWAERRGRALDAAVLRTILRARERDEGGIGMWPPGSVVELLLVRWPASGNGLPEREVMSATLDTFWRFLRATGAMAHASADIKALRREFRQTALQAWLPETTAPTPVAEPVDLQDRLDREAEVWNAAANRERFWDVEDWPRGPFTPPGEPGSESTDPAWYSRSSPSKCGPVVREAEFVQHCLAVAEWAGVGVEVSDKGYPIDSFEDDGLECPMLAHDLLWITCVRAGLVEVDGHRAWSAVGPLETDEEWADLGLQLVGNLLICLKYPHAELYAITGLFSPGFGGWAREVLVEWWWMATANPVGQRSAAPHRDSSETTVSRALELLTFLGVFAAVGEPADEYVPTAFGHDIGLAVLNLGMQGVFLEAS